MEVILYIQAENLALTQITGLILENWERATETWLKRPKLYELCMLCCVFIFSQNDIFSSIYWIVTIVRDKITIFWRSHVKLSSFGVIFHIVFIYCYLFFTKTVYLYLFGADMSWLWHCKTCFHCTKTISIFLLQTLLAFICNYLRNILAISERKL